MKVTVIVPTYNEAENIQKLIDTLEQVFKSIKSHHLSILVVDDNSPDGTADLVKKSQKKYQNLHLITGKKEGLGKAYLRGMKYASQKLQADVMFEMDADFSHDPKLIPAFLDKMESGYDLVVGSRYIKGGSIPQNWGWHRKLFSIIGNLVVRTALFNFGHHEWTNGYRAIRTPLYLNIRSKLEDYKGYTFQVAFLHQAFLQGARIGEIPNKFIDRVHGKSKIGSEYIFNLVKYLIISDLTNPPRQLRFLVVGTFGFVIQTIIYYFFWKAIGLDPALATIVGAEFAIISNFIFNNFWTFSDRKITSTPLVLLSKFVSFNLLSFGSPLIQGATVKLANTFISTSDSVTWVAYITGIFLGLIWNYTMYSKIIWKHKPATR